MGKVSTYLYFNGKTEEAFNYYKGVFGGDFEGPILRYGDSLGGKSNPMGVKENEKNLIMHISYPIIDGHRLMGTDLTHSMNTDNLETGNNFAITVEPDTKELMDRYFNALSDGGKILHPLHDSPWGSYHGGCRDKFGVSWIFDFPY